MDDLSIFFFCSEDFDVMPMLSLREAERSTAVLIGLIDEFKTAFDEAVLQIRGCHCPVPSKNSLRGKEDTVKLCRSVYKDTDGTFYIVLDWMSGKVTKEPLVTAVARFSVDILQFVEWVQGGCRGSRSIPCGAICAELLQLKGNGL
jgi:hypothetical protein